MNNTGRAFRYRAFVAMVMVFSGLTLPVTGIANHFYGFEPISPERHGWMAAHNAMGLLFVVFTVWHIVLNHRALWNHIRSAAPRFFIVSREAALAGALVAIVLVIFVGHAFHGV